MTRGRCGSLDLQRMKLSFTTPCRFNRRTEEPRIEQLQLSDELTQEFNTAVGKVIQKSSEKFADNDLVLRSYDAGSKPDPHEIEHLNLREHASVEKQVESLASLAQIPLFTIDDAFVAGLRFYAIILQPKQGTPLYCFRVYTPKKELSRSRLFAAMFAEGTFNRITQPVFLFDYGIDCMSRDGMMFIFKKHNFEKIFRFFELVMKMAEQTLRTIKAHVPIANFEEFQKACEGHLQMQAKLKNIASKPYLKKVKMADIKSVLKEFPHLGIKIAERNGKESLVFDPKNKWALLRLLDDDYLGSRLTGQRYEVTGKRPYQP
jgi:Kiwa protein KwaB-like